MISIVTTCKNRLDHLKQTLPLMLAQENAEVIVVDYGCVQGAADWVRTHHPSARVVEVRDDPVFALARARNAGAAQASYPLLCFVDADVRMLKDLSGWLAAHPLDRSFVLATHGAHLGGFIVVSRRDFERVGKYDEVIRQWGTEDSDLYDRLDYLQLSRVQIPRGYLSAIPHGDEIRQFGKEAGGFADRNQTLAFGYLYRMIKGDVRRLNGTELPLAARRTIYELLQGAAMNDGQERLSITITVPIAPKLNRHSHATRKLIYEAPTKPPLRRRAFQKDGNG